MHSTNREHTYRVLSIAPMLVRWVTQPSGTLSKRGVRRDIEPIRRTLGGGGPNVNGASSGSGSKACKSPVLKACRRIPPRWIPAAAASDMIICKHHMLVCCSPGWPDAYNCAHKFSASGHHTSRSDAASTKSSPLENPKLLPSFKAASNRSSSPTVNGIRVKMDVPCHGTS